MANLKLKEQPQETPAPVAGARLHPRFAHPQPTTAMERLAPTLKRLALFLLFAAIAMAAFMAVPFRHWDQHEEWETIREALSRLETQPDSLDGMRQLHAAASDAGILWNEPAGPRPEKWSQRSQGHRYDAAYGVVQTLSLGIILQGNAPRGFDELAHLHQRTGDASVQGIPSTDRLKIPVNNAQQKKACTACQAGLIEKPCTVCNGQGWATVSVSPKAFPLTASLRNTRSGRAITPAKMQKTTTERQTCFSCKGTSKQAIPCPSCSEKPDAGKPDAAQLAAVSSLIADSVKGTLSNIEKGMSIWRPIHALANAQRALLGDIAQDTRPQRPDGTNSDGSAAPASRANPLAYLQAACEALLAKPLSEPDAQTLADAARAETNPPALRNLAMSAYGISLILRNDPGTYDKVCENQKRTFDAPYPAPFFTESDYIADCGDCQGKGEKPNPCPHCMNPDAARKDAPACTWCKGKKTMLGRCITCNGKKNVFSPSDRVRAAYNNVLTELIDYCAASAADSP